MSTVAVQTSTLWATSADGKEVKTLVNSVVAQETVTQIVEVGTMVTHLGDENGQAAIAEEKPKLEIPSQPAPSTAPAEENKSLPKRSSSCGNREKFLKQEVTILQD